MSVILSLHGRLGANMFQYALGRLIAERLGLALHCLDPHATRRHLRQPSTVAAPSTLFELRTNFPNVALHLDGKEGVEPGELFDFDALPTWGGSIVPFASVLANPKPRLIRLRGDFQRLEYLEGSVDTLRTWFFLDSVDTPFEIGAHDVVLCISRGFEYGHRGWTLPLSYYERALERISPRGRVYVCGKGIDSDVRSRLARFEPLYYVATPIEQYSFLQRFRTLVLSNNPSAWWAAFLSSADTIVGPASVDGSGYAFKGYSDVDLAMPSTRYLEVDVGAFAQFRTHLTSRIRGAAVFEGMSSIAIVTSNNATAYVPASAGAAEVISSLTQVDRLSLSSDWCKDENTLQRLIKILIDFNIATVSHEYYDPT